MKNLFCFFMIICSCAQAQSDCIPFSKREKYADEYARCIDQHRAEYRLEFVTSERSPLTVKDTGYLRFFEPDPSWWVRAKFELTPDSISFELPTSSGKTKLYRHYARIYFSHEGVNYSLGVYQSETLKSIPKYANSLFLPFSDLTNGFTSYGGGRYIDLELSDFHGDGFVYIDFNRCYNPYCAYSGGYNCPIPPAGNRLNTKVIAGESDYAKPH